MLPSTISLLLLLSTSVVPAVVLPRPPSSPNNIQPSYLSAASQEDRSTDKQSYNGEKALYQSTNVEKPDTQDYRYLEIELGEADNVDSLDLHGLVQAVLNARQANQQQQQHGSLTSQANDDSIATSFVDDDGANQTLPHPIVVPHSILGVRDVGLGPNQRLFEPTRQQQQQQQQQQQHYLLSNESSANKKNFADEKLYYLKSGRPKVYVNVRGKTGNFRQDVGDSRVTVRIEPAAYLRATQAYNAERKTKAPKKYDAKLHGPSSSAASTTENTMVTSSELPKQIPAPPSRIPSRSPVTHTTPLQRYTLKRSDRVLSPGSTFTDS